MITVFYKAKEFGKCSAALCVSPDKTQLWGNLYSKLCCIAVSSKQLALPVLDFRGKIKTATLHFAGFIFSELKAKYIFRLIQILYLGQNCKTLYVIQTI